MAGKVHLWLGLASGLIVFIVAVTGCLYVFHKEAEDIFYHDVRFVEQQPASELAPPSAVLDSVRAVTDAPNPFYYDYTGKPAQTLLAGANEVRTHRVWAFEDGWTSAYVHPYTGEILAKWRHDDSWRGIIELAHASLLLPRDIGRPIVGAATLIFVVLLLTGLWLWWPIRLRSFKSKRGRRPLFKVTWTLGTKRFNYDLHNVVGFYSTLVLLIIAITGLVYSYDWVADGLYWVTSGGEWPGEHEHPESTVPPNWESADAVSIDEIYQRVRTERPGLESYGIVPPSDSASAVEIIIDDNETNNSASSELHFDQYTGELLEAERFEDKSMAAKLRQMNFGLHVGSVWGFPTKVIAFFASFVAATLPVTGFIIWWPKWRRQRRAKKRRREARAVVGAASGDGAAGDGAAGDGAAEDVPAARPVALDPESKLPPGVAPGEEERVSEQDA